MFIGPVRANFASAFAGFITKPNHGGHADQNEDNPYQSAGIIIPDKHTPLGIQDTAQAKTAHHSADRIRKGSHRSPKSEIGPAHPPEMFHQDKIIENKKRRQKQAVILEDRVTGNVSQQVSAGVKNIGDPHITGNHKNYSEDDASKGISKI